MNAQLEQNNADILSKPQVWALQRKDGGYVPPADEDGTEGFMAWSNEEEAMKGLEYQQAQHDIDAKVVRLA